ncbi:MAG: LysR substrate-binding domain-containing protein [Azonexus sp.]|nr:LysR substrate-binding domain-containing protein [Azonexus sp.]MCK6412330.1 LysR substrate-binding domain-containing protein [Azonexus sp.]
MADRRLQVFHAVAKHLSFTRAADALFMTQPAVTFQIKQLEEQYRTRLFERRHGSISLTSTGEMVLAYAEKILALGDELETRLGELTGEVRGPLMLGAATSIADHFLPPLLAEFNALHPRVRVTLIVANSANIEREVAEHRLDLGFSGAPPELPTLLGRICCEEELLVVCAPDHPLAAQASLGAGELADYEFIDREPGSGTRLRVEAYFRAHGVDPQTLKREMELGSPVSLKGVVATGLGFAILPRLAVDKEVGLGELRAIPLRPSLRRQLYLIHPQARFQPRVVSSFGEFVCQRLRELA